MDLPKVMLPPRQRIHLSFCPALGGCRYVGGLPSIAGADGCAKLDQLLDFNDEMLLHDKARGLYDKWSALPHRGKGTIGPGVLWSVDELDPYVKIDEFTDDPETHIHPGEEHPDCPACVKGVAHYHRKADGSPVRSPIDVPRETSGGDDASA